jgi:polysaccharide biosynthesis protein PslH
MGKPKVVIVASRFPFPLEKGDKLRLYHQIKILSTDFEICLIALSAHVVEQEHLEQLRTFCTEINIIKYNKYFALLRSAALCFNGKPFQVNMFNSNYLRNAICKIIKSYELQIIYVQLARVAELLRDHNNVIVDFQDAFSANYKRAAEVSMGVWKIIYAWEAKRMRKYEQEIMRVVSATTIISQQDKQLLNNANTIVVKNGIDTNYFKSSKASKKEFDLVFVGNLGYQPNAQAVQFLAKEILPKLLLHKPNIKLLIAGAAPSKEILALASNHIVIKPWLSNIKDAYNTGQIFVAPLFSGAGMQNKILEAMAMQVPCITTQLVADGIGAVDKQHLIVANSSDEFVTAIIALLNKSESSISLINNAYSFVQENYSWQQNTQPLIQLFTKLIAK